MEDRISAKNWVISFGPFRVTKASRSLERDGERVHLGSRAFDVLAHLLEHAGQVVTHRALLEAAWSGINVEEGNLRFQVTALRKALASAGSKCIINVPGRGYCFTAPVFREDKEELSPSSRDAAQRLNPLPRPLNLIGRADTVTAISGLVRTRRI